MLHEVGDLIIPKLSIKTLVQKYKTNFKLSPKPQFLETAIVRSFLFNK